MFIQPCFIRKNTPELREKLRKIGYRSMNRSDKEDEGECLLVCEGDEDLIDSYPFYAPRDNICCNYYDPSQVIDCGKNENLFLALAALRNNTDINQWFVCNEDYTCDLAEDPEYPTFKGEFLFNYVDNFNVYVDSCHWHKATVQELIKHFKK